MWNVLSVLAALSGHARSTFLKLNAVFYFQALCNMCSTAVTCVNSSIMLAKKRFANS